MAVLAAGTRGRGLPLHSGWGSLIFAVGSFYHGPGQAPADAGTAGRFGFVVHCFFTTPAFLLPKAFPLQFRPGQGTGGVPGRSYGEKASDRPPHNQRYRVARRLEGVRERSSAPARAPGTMACSLNSGCSVFLYLLLIELLVNGSVLAQRHNARRSKGHAEKPQRDVPRDMPRSQLPSPTSPTPHQSLPFSFEQEFMGATPPPDSQLPPSQCVRCCDTPVYPTFQAVPHINITILKGDKGDSGERGISGKSGKAGSTGPRGQNGAKGQKGNLGLPGDPCKNHYSAFSVGRKKSLHSNDYYQPLIFDTELVNLYGHFNMFSGKFFCYVPGVYFFNINVHTWNQKETYMHVMQNEKEVVILYAQPSDRSIMQSQSLMLQLSEKDEVWVRLFKGERDNAIFSDDFDTYITFNGYLIKASSEL